MLLLAILSGIAAPALALNPYDSQVDLTARNAIDELVFAKLEQLEHSAGHGLLGRGVCPARLSGRHRHAAHRAGGQGVPRWTGPRTSAAP